MGAPIRLSAGREGPAPRRRSARRRAGDWPGAAPEIGREGDLLARATNPERPEFARSDPVAKDIFWRAGPDGEWIAASPTWAIFTGIEGADPRGDRWLELPHIAVRGVPMLSPDGSVREWIGHSEDVTEGRLARQALDHERAMLQLLARGGSCAG